MSVLLLLFIYELSLAHIPRFDFCVESPRCPCNMLQCFEKRIGPNCECECPMEILEKEKVNDPNICGIGNSGQIYSSSGCGCSCPVGSDQCRSTQIFNQNKCECQRINGELAIDAPPGHRYGAFDQFCPHPIIGSNKCQSITDIASDLNEAGLLTCDRPNDCCLCKSIKCGSATIPCKSASFGIQSALGVQDIQIIGNLNTNTMIKCFGERACSHSRIDAIHIYDILCVAKYSCHHAHIIITDPIIGFGIDCRENGSCDGLTLDINFPSTPGIICNAANAEDIYLGSIECGAAESCKDAVFNVNNNGCNRVIFDSIECIEGSSCLGVQFNFNGFITIKNCQLSSNGPQPIEILDICYSNLLKLSCSDSTSCSNQVRNIINPINGFELLCEASMSCSSSLYRINIANNVEFIRIQCIASNACNKANFIISNQQIAVNVIIEIECIGENACFDTKFMSTNGDTFNVICNDPLFCGGCTYDGIPCHPSSVIV